ncbi:MAG: hypothetical protein RLY40_1379, partial [Pseudomonadota bacterium]
GTQVTITGTSFTGATSVTFGATPGTNVIVNSDTQITVTAPASAAEGAVRVIVTAPGGISPANPPTTNYTYIGAPVINPTYNYTGPVAGGTTVTLTGKNFFQPITVSFVRGGTAFGTITSISADGTRMTVVTPRSPFNAPGQVSMFVNNQVGSTAGYIGFVYQ